MKITIKCECGNELIITAPASKSTQFRDYLSSNRFYFGNVKIKENELKEFMIQCDKCKQWIILSVD